ncbi:hypothetical protein TcWFU_000382 [Taenia crassiceps]|uniref:H/ACA ribonucleoprotein complex non-core subunit NAF1 n=1 Tax=Taenia crassiceps TaxID=6207 RepID=A0ABR4QCE8_9CEST
MAYFRALALPYQLVVFCIHEAQDEKVLPDALVEASLSLSELASSEFDSMNELTIPDILSVFASEGSNSSSFQLVSMDKVYRNANEFSEGDVDSVSSSSSSSDEESIQQPAAGPPVHSSRAADLPLEIDPKYVPRLPSVLPEHAKLGILGKVSSIIKGCVVIASLPNLPPLDKGSALYLQNRRPLGEVYDTIGPVRSPFYVVIHENRQPPSKPLKARSQRATVGGTAASTTATSSTTTAASGGGSGGGGGGGDDGDGDVVNMTEGVERVLSQSPSEPSKLDVAVSVGDEVFYALDDPALSIKVLCSELSKLRGSDASGLKDEELSPDQQDFSDDEKEYAHRRKLEGKRPIGGNRRGRGDSGFTKRRSNHLSRQGVFRPGVDAMSKSCGGVGRSTPYPGLHSTYPSSQPINYQQPPPSSVQQGFLRPSLLGSQGVVSQQTVLRQPVQFMQQQSIPFASWNVAPIPYAYFGPQIPSWQFANSNYFPQQAMMPQIIPSSHPRQQVGQESRSSNYESSLDGVVEPTPLPAFTTGTPPRQEDPPAL